MFSLTSQYALRAVVHLARNYKRGSMTCIALAEHTDLSSKYLAKILVDLVRCGVLHGTRGRKGGFRLIRDPKDILIEEVLSPFEPTYSTDRVCPLGNEL